MQTGGSSLRGPCGQRVDRQPAAQWRSAASLPVGFAGRVQVHSRRRQRCLDHTRCRVPAGHKRILCHGPDVLEGAVKVMCKPIQYLGPQTHFILKIQGIGACSGILLPKPSPPTIPGCAGGVLLRLLGRVPAVLAADEARRAGQLTPAAARCAIAPRVSVHPWCVQLASGLTP